MKRFVNVVGLLCLAACAALAGEMTFQQHATVMDSLSRVHPRMRASWLKERGIRDEYWQGCVLPADSGLHEVGRWSYGPSYDVYGRVTPSETLVALARGSGVSLIRFSRLDSLQLELLSDINAGGLMKRVAVRDTLLYVGSTAGLEVWSIADERSPTRLSWLHTALNDFDVQDSLAYIIGPDDSFRVYNVSDPASPAFRGACHDSGSSVAVTGNLALVGDRWGLYLLDVSDPSNPYRVSAWGSAIDAIATRGNLALVTQFNPSQPGELKLSALDVAEPLNLRLLGSLDGTGGLNVRLVDTLVFCSGDGNDHSLKIVSVADSTHPWLIGAAASPGWGTGVWASGVNKTAFHTAHFQGLGVYDVANSTNPIRDTIVCAAGPAEDVYLDHNKAYVAQLETGLAILDVSDPTSPILLGQADTLGTRPSTHTAVAQDSFAYIEWTGVPFFRSFDVSDPYDPVLAGGVDIVNPAEDMVLRDSFVYVAEGGRLQIVNVARPRQPALVGTCVIGNAGDLVVVDTLAFVSRFIVSVADPSNPVEVGSLLSVQGYAIAVRDTFAFAPDQYDSLVVFSVANPAAPSKVSSLRMSGGHFGNWGAVLEGDRLYIGGDILHVVDVADPASPKEVGHWHPPYDIRRLYYAPPYLYAACWDAGVCVLESVPTGVAEQRPAPRPHGLRVWPSPARDEVTVILHEPVRPSDIRAYDVSGREWQVVAREDPSSAAVLRISVKQLPAGVYMLRVGCGSRTAAGKVVRQRR